MHDGNSSLVVLQRGPSQLVPGNAARTGYLNITNRRAFDFHCVAVAA
jgi:hypothetical protein